LAGYREPLLHPAEDGFQIAALGNMDEKRMIGGRAGDFENL
jgi:hypothetical protein